MDETSYNDTGMTAWESARLGNAIDSLVDRVVNRPQMVADASQAYGVDAQGRIYQLGQVNGQMNPQQAGLPAQQNKMLPWIILAAIAYFVIEGGA